MNKTLLRGGTVITCDHKLGTLERADVLIENGRITQIAESINDAHATVVDVSDQIVMPGIIDTHRHVSDVVFAGYGADLTLTSYFQNVPSHYFAADNIRRVSRAGARFAFNSGVTTILDWCLAAHDLEAADAALDGYEEAGARVVFAYGPGSGVIGDTPDFSKSPLHTDSVHLKARCQNNERGLLELWFAARGPDFTTFEIARDEIAMVRDLGLKASMHVGGCTFGSNGGTMRCAEAGLLGPDLQFVHCCNLSDAEVQAMAETGVVASVNPYAEASMGLGPNPFLRLRAAGIPVGLGTDSAAITGHGLFGDARALLVEERGRRHRQMVKEGRDPENNDFLTAEMVIKALTIDSAASLGLADQIGSISLGKQADIITFKKSRLGVWPYQPESGVILSGESMAIDNVMIAGRWVKRHGGLVDADFDSMVEEMAEIRRTAPLRFIGEPA